MRVLITRPEREAMALAEALRQRGHECVIAPLFEMQILRPPQDFAPALAACQAVLLTSANGARALALASEQRSKPVFAVGDTTASTAEGLGFVKVTSASGDGAALAELVRGRLDPRDGLLLHVSGADVAGDIAGDLAPANFEVRRFALYEARAAENLPDAARAALAAGTLEAASFFSPRSSALFARLTENAALAQACGSVTAIAISPPAALPLKALPFRAIHVATRPTRQAVLDEIDRLAMEVVQTQQQHQPRQHSMSDNPSPPPARPAPARRGIGLFGAFVTALLAAAIVLAGAIVSLPYWPQQARELWRGPPAPVVAPPPPPTVDVAAIANGALEAAKREFNPRLDDLDKRVRAAATTAAQADRPPASDPAIAELRGKLEALANRPAMNSAETEKQIAALKDEIDQLRAALADAADRTKAYTTALSSGEQKALAAARASAVIGIAARLSAALDSGLPFATDLALLAPLAKEDAKLGEITAALQPLAGSGVASRERLAASFPAAARAALADDLADDSFWQRLLGKLRALVSLRRVGADVPGDSVEAKLARAEAALDTGNVAQAVDIVKSLPAQTARATALWLSDARGHLEAQRAIDQLAAYGVSQLGAAQ